MHDSCVTRRHEFYRRRRRSKAILLFELPQPGFLILRASVTLSSLSYCRDGYSCLSPSLSASSSFFFYLSFTLLLWCGILIAFPADVFRPIHRHNRSEEVVAAATGSIDGSNPRSNLEIEREEKVDKVQRRRNIKQFSLTLGSSFLLFETWGSRQTSSNSTHTTGWWR